MTVPIMDQNQEPGEPSPTTVVPSNPTTLPFDDPSEIGRYRVIRLLGRLVRRRALLQLAEP
jgi:hypothetical protein